MKGFFVQDTQCTPYAFAITAGYKTIETRSRNMLSALVGERVAVVRTRNGKNPLVVGYVDIVSASFCKAEEFRQHYSEHLVPEGSKYDCNGRGKWFYHLANPEFLQYPYQLPENTVRHGRSWCEF